MPVSEAIKDMTVRIEKTIATVRKEFSHIRTGRASATVLMTSGSSITAADAISQLATSRFRTRVIVVTPGMPVPVRRSTKPSEPISTRSISMGRF